jgi:hypothetical protein
VTTPGAAIGIAVFLTKVDWPRLFPRVDFRGFEPGGREFESLRAGTEMPARGLRRLARLNADELGVGAIRCESQLAGRYRQVDGDNHEYFDNLAQAHGCRPRRL